MTSIVDIDVPTDTTALSACFEAVPSLTCEMEQVIASSGYELWLSGGSEEEIDAALADASSIATHELITRDQNRWLYEIRFDSDAIDVFEIVLNEGGTVLSASASNGSWLLSIRFVERDNVSALYDRLLEHDIRPQVVRLYELAEDTYSQCGLTRQQYETLVAAINHGYFEIPRDVSMQELAEELDISHQALSERLRRAYRALVATELDVTDDKRPTPSIPSN